MQIRVSTRDCRTAVGSALLAIEEAITKTHKTIWDSAYQALHDGAIHNGLVVDAAREQEMRDMVDRDVDHMMEKQAGKQTVEVLKNFIDMLAYHKGEDIVIDDNDFHLLKAYLPTS